MVSTGPINDYGVVHLSITEDRAEVITIDDAESVIDETKPKGQVTMMVAEHVSTPSTSTSLRSIYTRINFNTFLYTIDNGGGVGNARIRNMYSPRHGHAHFMSTVRCSTAHLHYSLHRQKGSL